MVYFDVAIIECGNITPSVEYGRFSVPDQ